MKKSKYNHVIETKNPDSFLIYNALKNSLIEVNNLELNMINNLNFEEENSQLVITLKEYGVIIEDDIDENKTVRILAENRLKHLKKDHKNIVLTILPTFLCNFKCIYCYESESIRKENKMMDELIQDQIVGYIEKEFNEGKKELTVLYYGGEPLIGISVIKRLHPKIKALCEQFNIKAEYSMITNGILLTDEIIEYFSEQQINSLQITIDGTREIHNKRRYYPAQPDKNYDILLQNIKKCIAKDIKIQLRVNVDNENNESYKALIDDLIEKDIWDPRKIDIYLGWVHDNVCGQVPMDRQKFYETEEEFRQYKVFKFNELSNVKQAKLQFNYPSLSSGSCSYTNLVESWTISPDGSIGRCWDCLSNDFDPLCNIIDLLDDKKRAEIKSLVSKNTIQFEDKEKLGCLSCKFLPICEPMCFPIYQKFQDRTRLCPEWRYLNIKLLSQYNFYLKHPELCSNFEFDREV